MRKLILSLAAISCLGSLILIQAREPESGGVSPSAGSPARSQKRSRNSKLRKSKHQPAQPRKAAPAVPQQSPPPPTPAPTPAQIEIVDKVRQFYTDAWNMLITYVMILLGVVGVLIPVTIGWYQNRAFRREEQKLKDDLIKSNTALIESLINQKAAEFKENLDQDLKHRMLPLEQKNARSLTSSYMVQATRLWDEGRFPEALESGLSAIKCAVESADQANVQRALINVTREIFPKITKDDYEQRTYLRKNIEDTIKTLEKENEDRRYTNYLRDFQEAHAKSLERDVGAE